MPPAALASPLSGGLALPRFSTVAADPSDTLVVLGVTSPGSGYDVVSADFSEEGALPSDDWAYVGSGAASPEEAFFYDVLPDSGVSRFYFVTASGPQSEAGRADGRSSGEARVPTIVAGRGTRTPLATAYAARFARVIPRVPAND